jgi:hypothetical protein
VLKENCITMIQIVRSYMQYTRPGHVTLKILQCLLFVFFNRAKRVVRNGSIIIDSLDLDGTTILPLLISAVLHIALLCPGLVVPTRRGRIAVLFSLLHVVLLYLCAAFLVTFTLTRYITTASFVSVLLASHLCLVVRPLDPELVPAQKLSYGYFMDVAAYVIPISSWILLPVFRVHALEAIVLLYLPEALCFVFAYTIEVITLLLNVAVVAGCSMWGVADTNHAD